LISICYNNVNLLKKLFFYKTLSEPPSRQLPGIDESRGVEVFRTLFVMKVCMDYEKGGGEGVKSLFGRESRGSAKLGRWAVDAYL
jgi:hypothetical protein